MTDPPKFEFTIPKGAIVTVALDIMDLDEMKPDDPALKSEIIKSAYNFVKNTPEIQEIIKREKMSRAAENN